MALIALDFSDSPRQAFLRGIAKGMGAPLMVFAANTSASSKMEFVDLPPVSMVRLPDHIATMTDVQRLGMDFNAALRRYEQANPQQTARSSRRSG